MNLSTEPKPGLEDCAYGDHLDIFRGLALFAGAPLTAIKVLAYVSRAETFEPGDVLARQGEHSRAFHFVMCGQAQAVCVADGREVVVRELRPGDWFGGLGLVVEAKSLFTVRATGRTRTLALDREMFAKTVERFPLVLPAMLKSLAGHVLAWEEGFLKRRPEEFAALSPEFGVSLF